MAVKLLAMLMIWIFGLCFGGWLVQHNPNRCVSPTVEHHGGRTHQPPPQPRNWDQDA